MAEQGRADLGQNVFQPSQKGNFLQSPRLASLGLLPGVCRNASQFRAIGEPGRRAGSLCCALPPRIASPKPIYGLGDYHLLSGADDFWAEGAAFCYAKDINNEQ